MTDTPEVAALKARLAKACGLLDRAQHRISRSYLPLKKAIIDFLEKGG